MKIKDVHLGMIEVGDPECIVFDMDGTLADNSHRVVWLQTKPKNWKAYNKTMSEDVPIDWVCELAKKFYIESRDVIFCSAREEVYRDVTEAWIYEHLGIKDRPLYMRAKSDYRKDSIVKEELLDRIIADGYTPDLILDDRDQVVEMWRSKGLTCVQVAEGDF